MTLFIIGCILLAYFNIFWMKRIDEVETFYINENGKVPMFSWESPWYFKVWIVLSTIPPLSIMVALVIIGEIRRGKLKLK